MNGLSADGLLEAGDVMEAEGDDASEEATPRRISTSGQTSRLGMGDDDGEEATGRGILPSVTLSYQRSAKFGHGMTEAGGAMEAEGDSEGEEVTPRRILSSFTPSSQRPPNFRKQFLMPHVVSPCLDLLHPVFITSLTCLIRLFPIPLRLLV